MKTMKLLPSGKSGLLCAVHICIFLAGFARVASAQPGADLARLQAKYPGNLYIAEAINYDVTFKMTKTGEPEMSFTEYSSLFILGDNSTILITSLQTMVQDI